MPITRATFNLILDIIAPCIFKEPTNLKPKSISVDTQLGLTLYRLGYGVFYSTLSQLFGVLISVVSETFNKVCRVLVVASHDQYVRFLAKTDEEWESEVKAFIENYEFPCVGAWDGFHVYVSCKLKSFIALRDNSLSNLGLVGYNERYLYCGFFIIWEGCFRKYSTRQRNCIRRTYPWLLLEILLAKHAWLLKGYNEDSRDPKQRYFNTKLCSARVVTENAYEMLKVIVRILYKKAE